MNEKLARILSRTERVGDCLIWQGPTNTFGYGAVGLTVYGEQLAHRAVMYLSGHDLTGMEVHHKCRVRACIEYTHLEVLTPEAHDAHNTNAARTHCPQGHPYDEANTRVYTKPNGLKARHCRTCSNVATNRYRKNKRLQERLARDAAQSSDASQQSL